MSVHATRVSDAFVERWIQVDDETEIAIVYDLAINVDTRRKLFARLDYAEAHQVADRLGASIVSRETLEKVRLAAAAILEPYTLPADSLMASLERCLQHDREVWERIDALGLPVDALILGMGKHHIAGAPPGRCYLMGWWTRFLERYTSSRRGPGWVQQGAAPGSPGPHGAGQRDYATTTILERRRRSLGSRIVGSVTAAVSWLVGGLRPTASLVSPDGDIDRMPSLGDRALAIAAKELGVKETPGPGIAKRVSEYLSVCVGRPERGAAASGKPLGLVDDAVPWCSAFASWCMLQALQAGDARPHEPRAAVWELVADARERGTWRDVSTGYRPRPGDLGIYKRAGGDPRIKGQSGHVDRVETTGADSYTAIGGNEGDMVKREAQRYDAADLCGWVAYG